MKRRRLISEAATRKLREAAEPGTPETGRLDNFCFRTYRQCIGGAWDGNDGGSIDCPQMIREDCPYLGDVR